MKTKILFAYHSMDNAGGAERALITLLKNLPPEEYSIDLLMWDDKGYHYTQIPAYVNILEPLWQLAFLSREIVPMLRARGMEREAQVREEITRLNKTEGLDHLRNWEMMKTIVPNYTGYDIAVAFNETIILKVVADKVEVARKIAWIHMDYRHYINQKGGGKTWLWPQVQLPFYEKMDAIVCVTPQNMAAFNECFPTLADKTIFLPNMMDIEGIKSQAEEYLPGGIGEEKTHLFTASRLHHQKGIDFAIEAAGILRDRGYAFVWDIAGNKDTPEYPQYREMISARRLEKEVRLLGERPNPYPYFKHCDIYVHPSRFEGKPLALDEAKLFARPIVTTRFSSVAESIVDGEQGMVCDMSGEALATALMALIDDKTLRARLSANLRGWRYDNGLPAYKELFSLS